MEEDKPKFVLLPGKGKESIQEIELDPDSSYEYTSSLMNSDGNIRYFSWRSGENHLWTVKQMLGFAERRVEMIHQKQAVLLCFDKGRPDLVTWLAAGGLNRLDIAMHLDAIKAKFYREWEEKE